MQRNWIGRSEGLHVRFALENAAPELPREVKVYTTRPDTLFGASFLALSPGHPLTEALAANDSALAAFVEECRRGGTSTAEIETQEKMGYDTGLKVAHPLGGPHLPVYVANFVLMEYGTGAIFGCPAHDQRDLDFARKYGLPVTPVVLPPGADPAEFEIGDVACDGEGTLYHSGFLDGLSIPDAKEAVAAKLEKQIARQRAGRRAGDQFPPARLGHLAPALPGLPDPDHPLRELRPGSRTGGPAPRAPAG